MSISVTPTNETLQSSTLASLASGTKITALVDGSNGLNFAIAWAATIDGSGYPTAINYVSQTNPLPTDLIAALPAGENHLGEVSGNTSQVLVTIARPTDTTPYAALDSVNTSTSAPTIITFTNAGRASGVTGYVTKVKILTNQSTNIAQLRLHLFNTNAPTLPNDNAAYAMMWADRAIYLGFIDLPPFATEGTGSDCARTEISGNLLAFKCASADRNLYGLLETLTVFTPANAQNFQIELACESN